MYGDEIQVLEITVCDTWAVVDLGDCVEDESCEDKRLNGCSIGDQVSAPRLWGAYRHHGVLLEENMILHVNAGPFSGFEVCLGLKPALVRKDPIERFLKGSECLTFEYRSSVPRAFKPLESIVGDPVPYNILFNNCEHYASQAAGSESPHSPQIERIMISAAVLLGFVLCVPTITPLSALGACASAIGAVEIHRHHR